MPESGLLVVDKPSGITSHDVVAIVRRVTGERSVGHLGTLDPMASGVLPLLLGRYTRLAQFFAQAEKQYTGTIRFGFATDTYDAEGTATGEPQPLTLDLAQLRTLATRFSGPMQQMPPVYSAKKLGGVPAHKLARAGQPVPVRPALVTVHHFALEALEGDTAPFAITLSAGGYVRSVAHDLGALAGCGAHLASLRRTRAGAFSLAGAVTLEQLKQLSQVDEAARDQAVAALLKHPRTLLPELPAVTVDEGTATRLRNGMQVNLPEFSTAPMVKVFTSPTHLVAVARRIAGTLMQPDVVIA